MSTGTSTIPAVGTRWQLLALIPGLAGLWLVASPFVLDFPEAYPHQLALLVSVILGTLVVLLSVAQGVWWSAGRSASRGNLLLGLLLLLSPLVFDYWHFRGPDSSATVSSVVSGLVVLIGAAFCLAAPGPDRP
jgi:hypothetical protein